MLFSDYNPLQRKKLSILDPSAKIVSPDLEPDLSKEKLLGMYKTMSLGRIADVKAVQYQRQGRMLTYAPNRGQEAAQVGAAAALDKMDWFAPSFREMNALLYLGVTLEQIFLYWYGNEWGNHFDKGVRVLPIDVIIGSQVNHAAGIAYASKILKKNEVAIATIGDGGTSHGEFYEGMNYAATFDVPLVVVIQNNQYAISTPRSKASKAQTLAQKAIAFGIPGIQVDGNDILAMYVATKKAVDYARSGKGPVLIEACTYRLGAHTTADDPTIYRSNEEVQEWEAKEPMIRFKKYLINKGYWSEEEDKLLEIENIKTVGSIFKKVEVSGPSKLEDIFKYTYKEMTPQLTEQYEEYKKHLKDGGK